MIEDLSVAGEFKEMLELSERLNLPFLRLSHYEIPPEAIEFLSCGLMTTKIALNYKIIPVAKFGPVLTVAMADPLNVVVLDELCALTAMEISPVVSMASEIGEAIELYTTTETDLSGLKLEESADFSFASAVSEEEKVNVYQLTEISAQEAVINTVNNCLREAVRLKASDIHLETYEPHLRLRYRIDGALQHRGEFSLEMQSALFARIKIMSGLDITERRVPQDGRFSINFEGREVDFRVSLLPTFLGEKAVLRILDKQAMKLDLSSLGFSPGALEIYEQAISSPYGLILITGPTGSGKSTSLYSMLSKLNTLDKNIVTIEDPIEYYLKGITQIQIKPEIGLSFAQCLRAVLRQSPDIIMLGEIRDMETADIAMKAALTGHLVLSTLHTNDALSSISRLLDMGVEPFLISAAIRMVSAQRLCRRLCPDCKEKYPIKPEVLKKNSLEIKDAEAELWRAKGCGTCANLGYKGRVAIAEAVLIDEALREMIIKKVSLEEIKEYARGQGMKSLRDDGFEKAILGEVALEEILRVTAEA